VLIAGDDASAKSTLAGIVTSGGLEALDAGTLSRARELEALGFLQLTLALAEAVPWTGGFGWSPDPLPPCSPPIRSTQRTAEPVGATTAVRLSLAVPFVAASGAAPRVVTRTGRTVVASERRPRT
jgi:hypothetical protein